MQIYLGLDVGTYSIKAVVLKLDASRYYIEQMVEQTIVYLPQYDEKTLKIQTLRAVLAALNENKFDAVYATFGSQHTVLKKFNLNNIQRSDRQKVIENEFDLLGVFDLNDYIVEYHTIEFQPKFAKLMGILIHKPAAKQLIDVLAECSLNVRVIDIDNIVYLNLTRFLPISKGGTHLAAKTAQVIVEIGHSKTVLTVIGAGKVTNCRVFHMGGLSLTSMLQSQLNLNFEQAQFLKHTIESQPSHQKYDEALTLIMKFFDELSLEVKRTLKTIHSQDLVHFENLFLTGGSSQFHGLKEIFEKNTGVACSYLNEFNEKLAFTLPGKVEVPVFSQAIACVLRGDFDKENSKINIRHGELALMSNYEKIITELVNYFKIVGIILFVLLSVYLVRYFLFNSKINEIKTHFKKDVVELFINEPHELKLISNAKKWDFNLYSNHALKIVEANLNQKKQFVADMNPHSTPMPLDVLNQISLAIPASLYFEVVEFKLSDTNLYIEADTTDSGSLEKIMSALQGVKILEQVQKKSESSKAGSDGKILHFVITANVLKEGE